MNDARPTFTIGIEEEYLLVDRQSRNLVIDPPAQFLADCRARLGPQVSPEFFRCQIEVGTRVATSLGAARQDLVELRRGIADCAAGHGFAPIAAGIHPFGDWSVQLPTDKPRYRRIADDLAAPGRRLVICGMHVHVAIEDEAARFDLLNQMRYFVPHFLALSASSPFWRGEPTGLKSYRLSTQREIPRGGFPPVFATADDYHRAIAMLVTAGVLPDASKIWWLIRPSHRYPTIELRVADICTRIDDGIAIAALYRCTLRMLWRLRQQNLRWRSYSEVLLEENLWLAQRFGRDAALFDLGKGGTVPLADLVDEWLGLIAEDAAFFGCEAEVAGARRIVAEGTSADRQLAVYESAVADGRPHQEALNAVVDHLIAETVDSGTSRRRRGNGMERPRPPITPMPS
jgi:carboxylate-amine ligase